MGRSRSSGRSAPASPRRAPAPAPAQAAPAPAPMQQQQSGGMMSGLMGTMAQGFAFGAGSSVAHHAVGAAVNSFSGGKEQPAEAAPAQQYEPVQQQQMQQPVCYNDQKAFIDCLNTHNSDISACQYYLDALNVCKQQSAYQ
ncbi:TPA: hypothetical protein N0F65_002683 [Lagenidium giganteum]|uniref:CHCH domain-containing protein n=1 Tax=Lagenidium giganteum TaxID=4803 RepID=A0AAV2Z262_9STRA|nr:TPA: hypothetical protein N0F65_002683 [Lagenidium giganteum]